jgi:hypothetical protein
MVEISSPNGNRVVAGADVDWRSCTESPVTIPEQNSHRALARTAVGNCQIKDSVMIEIGAYQLVRFGPGGVVGAKGKMAPTLVEDDGHTIRLVIRYCEIGITVAVEVSTDDSCGPGASQPSLLAEVYGLGGGSESRCGEQRGRYKYSESPTLHMSVIFSGEQTNQGCC